MVITLQAIVFSALAYLLGSLSFAVLVSRLFALPDPRGYGSGNPGATNVLRSGRKAAAALTLLGDGLKGWLAVILAQHFARLPGGGEDTTAVALAAAAVFLGHIYPVFFRFRGGKGVATALGVLLAFNVWLGLSAIATWLLAFALFRVSSLGALAAALTAPLYASYLLDVRPYFAVVTGLTLLLVIRHRDNLRKLLAGEEASFKKRRPDQG